jgi:hypothetical protein
MTNNLKRYNSEHDMENNYATDMAENTVIAVIKDGALFYVFYT